MMMLLSIQILISLAMTVKAAYSEYKYHYIYL